MTFWDPENDISELKKQTGMLGVKSFSDIYLAQRGSSMSLFCCMSVGPGT